MLVASCGATPTQPRLYRVVPVVVTPPAGMTVNAAFDLPYVVEVIVKADAIRRCEIPLQTRRGFQDPIQNAAILGSTRPTLCRSGP